MVSMIISESVRPLLTDEEYAHTVKVVEEFRKPGGVGEKLQVKHVPYI